MEKHNEYSNVINADNKLPEVMDKLNTYFDSVSTFHAEGIEGLVAAHKQLGDAQAKADSERLLNRQINECTKQDFERSQNLISDLIGRVIELEKTNLEAIKKNAELQYEVKKANMLNDSLKEEYQHKINVVREQSKAERNKRVVDLKDQLTNARKDNLELRKTLEKAEEAVEEAGNSNTRLLVRSVIDNLVSIQREKRGFFTRTQYVPVFSDEEQTSLNRAADILTHALEYQDEKVTKMMQDVTDKVQGYGQ